MQNLSNFQGDVSINSRLTVFSDTLILGNIITPNNIEANFITLNDLTINDRLTVGADTISNGTIYGNGIIILFPFKIILHGFVFHFYF